MQNQQAKYMQNTAKKQNLKTIQGSTPYTKNKNLYYLDIYIYILFSRDIYVTYLFTCFMYIVLNRFQFQ
jgi:hypothetical protein